MNYTITDLTTRTDLMVRIETPEQAKQLKAAGVEFRYYGNHNYYGFLTPLICFIWLDQDDQEGRTIVPFDEIDFGVKEEEKEEVKVYPFYHYAKGNYSCNCAICKETFIGDKRAAMCLECAIKQHHIEIDFAYSEIARLKAENEELNAKLRESSQISQDQEKRERMAWDMIIKNGWFYQGDFTDFGKIDIAIEFVDKFLAKSKEVKP